MTKIENYDILKEKDEVSILINRKEEIKQRNLSMNIGDDIQSTNNFKEAVDFSKIKIGAKVLEDAILEFNSFKKLDANLGDKKNVLQAIYNQDFSRMREISNFFYKTSGIYSRLCRYMAYLYRYDWMVTPFINEDVNKEEKVKMASLNGFHKVLMYLDNLEVKRFLGEVALKVIKDGCYYGYIIPRDKTVSVQELPPSYCRTRFSINNKPAVEFNMAFFDEQFRDAYQKMKMLDLFPKEFKKGYLLYKEGKLLPQFKGDKPGWYLLEPENTIKFNINGEDFPAFIAVIPAIIDLDSSKALDRKKMEQELLKIIIQKMPIDKNGDLVFDIDEAQQLHNNAVSMLKKAIGIDVLTTFADIDVADMSDKNRTAAHDDLEKAERSVYNEAGVSQMQFNTNGNLALEKSILNDEAAMYNLIAQFESFLNGVIQKFNEKPKKYYFRVQILPTTIYNYKELAKLYKEQTQLGYSKMLPQIALGQSQSSILANAYFENEVLDLVNLFIPPLMSSTMNTDILKKKQDNGESTGGRPEKADDEKSEKTIMNEESLS